MADKIAAMEAFVLAVEHNGFSAAARLMNVATSTVTRLVDQLEHMLGTTLINRSTRKLTLTAAGAIYYDHAIRLLRDISLAEENIRDLDTEPRGLLHITMPVTLGRLCIMPIINRFMKAHPQLRVNIHVSDEIADLLIDDIDIAIRIDALPTSNNHIVTRIAPHTRYIVGSPDYFTRHAKPDMPSDLNHHHCLLFDYHNGQYQWHFYDMQNEGNVIAISPQARLITNNSEILLESVLSGLGVSLLPDWLANPYLASGAVESVLDNYVVNTHIHHTGVYAMYPENRKTMKKVRLFIDYLKAHYPCYASAYNSSS